MNDDVALRKLRQYLDEGKSYYEATIFLKKQGATQLQINNVTFAYKSGKKDTQFNPELANSLANVAKTETNDKATENRRKGIFVFPGGGFPLMKVGGTLNSWWYFVPFIILMCVFLYYFSTQL